jgi:hypothetical protein
VVSDIEVTDRWIVAAVTEATWTSSRVVSVPIPLTDGQSGAITATNTYHRTHTAWETEAPITTMFVLEDGGQTWIGASYQCAPVVRFALGDLVAGAPEVVGTTPFDYGPFRQVEEFAVVGAGAEARVFASVFGLGGTVVGAGLFLEPGEVNERAPIVFSRAGVPVHPLAGAAGEVGDLVDIEVLGGDRLVRLDTEGRLSIMTVPT